MKEKNDFLFSKDEVKDIFSESLDVNNLQEEITKINYKETSVKEASLRLAFFLLYPSTLESGGIVRPKFDSEALLTDYEVWVKDLKEKGYRKKSAVAASWALGKGAGYKGVKISQYAIFLFNNNYGKTRKSFETLLFLEKEPPPYLSLLILNIIHQSLDVSLDDLRRLMLESDFSKMALHIMRIFNENNSLFEDWISNKKMDLKFYAGATNTVLNLYSEYFTEEGMQKTGLNFLEKKHDISFDLGGGFNSSEMERLFSKNFISADILSSDLCLYDPKIIIQEKTEDGKQIVSSEISRAEFIKKQSKIQYLYFDVFTSSFPVDFKSYLITSSGFTTSTVGPRKGIQKRKEMKRGRGHLFVSLSAIYRVLELVHAGKKVDFFTIQRASSRDYKFKTVLLQWQAGRLINLVTTLDENNSKKTSSSYKIKIDHEDEFAHIFKLISPFCK